MGVAKNILVIDILGKSESRSIYSRYTRANNMSIGPQAVAVWCQQLGHNVSLAFYDGPVFLAGEEPDNPDAVFIGSYTQTAYLAYALSAYYRSKGAVTILGGPHPRSYPDHSKRYFDYCLGFTDKELLKDILDDLQSNPEEGVYLSNDRQPKTLPSMEERWKFMEPAIDKSPIVKMIPMIGSLGCPYTCSFCTDALVPYQPLEYEVLKDDLRFVHQKKIKRGLIVWHDPNFGIRFNDYMNVIEEAVPAKSLTYLAETSLSRLSEENCKRMADAGFKVMAPGIESWYDIGDKSKMRSTKGHEKVERIADHVNMVLKYIPYVQTNLILGLDADEGTEPFELTKKFVDLAPGAYPYFSLLTAYGRNAPDNLGYQESNRVLNVPFHFLNQIHAINIILKNYSAKEFFRHVCDVYEYAYSRKAVMRRFFAVKDPLSRIELLFRGLSSEKGHKLRNHKLTLARLGNPKVQAYFRGKTSELPDFFYKPIQEDLQWLWEWLPKEAIYHNPNAYIDSLNDAAEGVPVAKAGMAV